MTAVLTVSAIFFGVMSYLRLPVNDLPAVDYPVIQVLASYPGASPETIANTIAAPLERQFMQIHGLELVTSKSTQGNASLTLQFHLDKSIDAAATDVQTAISQASGFLPTDMPSPPTFSKTNPNDQPILYIAMTSDSVTLGQLYDYANTQVGQRLSIVPGVSKVLVFGTKSAVRIKAGSRREWRCVTSPSTILPPPSERDGPDRRRAARRSRGDAGAAPLGQLEDATSYANLIVATRDGVPVYVRDIARVEESVQDERLNMRFWARGYNVPSATVIVAVPPPGGRQRGRGRQGRPGRACPPSGASSPVGAHHARLRPLADDRPLGAGRPGDAAHRLRAGRRRDLRLPGPGVGHR
jgi:HAE1 family hydrophobic/amphiphilic exporter-1